jgi:hypothetical protein
MRTADTVLAIIRDRNDLDTRNEQLDSGVPGNRHAPFGGGRLEKGTERTSPAAYPTRSRASSSSNVRCTAVATSTCSACASFIAAKSITTKEGEPTS